MTTRVPIEFGSIIIDKLHMAFGYSDPTAFVVADMWANEDDGDEECWVDHYRGHVRKPFAELRDENRYVIVGRASTECGVSIIQQCNAAADRWTKDNQEWVTARSAKNQKELSKAQSARP